MPFRIRLVAQWYCVFALSFSFSARSQHLNIGVIAGSAITNDYPYTYFPGTTIRLPDGTIAVVLPYETHTGSRSFIGGPVIEWRFNRQWSFEADGIYRRLRPAETGPTVTWEFPLLAKYRFPIDRITPFVEAGPSFRTTGNLNTNPSHTGFSAGAGIEMMWGGFLLAPTLRYTRWAADPVWTLRSKQDQLEALFSFSHGTADRQPFGRRISFGLTGGISLNRPVRDSRATTDPGSPYYFDTSRTYDHSWIIGPRVEIGLSEHWSVLGEATYRQIRFQDVSIFDYVDQDGVRHQGQSADNGVSAVLWQFPALMKYRLGNRRVQPFVEAGPAFRLPQELGNQLSIFGIAGGAGARLRWHRLNFEAGLRYSYWGSAHSRNGEVSSNEVRRNQLDTVFAVTF